MLAEKSGTIVQDGEMKPRGISDKTEAFEGDGSEEERGGEDPTGQSAGTMVGNMIPSVQ